VTGVATPLHLGGLVATYEIVITDSDGQRICTARLTCLLRKP
jgi:1,4-dihydroxy-2-naphthoyl-CoA hydrolase